MFFVNNATYGMTGGQMAPTTILGQKTTTTPAGRTQGIHGSPLPVAELISTLPPVAFVARSTVTDAKEIIKTKKYIMKAFQNQIDNVGFSFVEILSPCPTDWGMTAQKSIAWIRESMQPVYQPGILKDMSE